MSLEELRREIDNTDVEIINLIVHRTNISEQIGREKKELNIPIRDPEREKKVLDRIKQLAREKKLNEYDIEAIFRQLILTSSSVQGTVVAFQGEIGAYSEEAAYKYFGNAITVKPCESFDDVFSIVEKQNVNYGIVPVENSLEGSISRTYDLLLDSDIKVIGETELRIIHCLIANPGVNIAGVKKVYSHPQALGQCQTYLKHLGVEIIPAYDTAGSVKMIKDKHITNGAAIASTRAAEIYQMPVIAREIEDNPHNFTRFFILGRHIPPPTGNDKTSIVFSVKHQPGTLFELLKRLALRNINLTKIESRPTRQKPWEYNFYLDFEGHQNDKAATEALASIREFALYIKVLGSYPKAKQII
jgi:chorismate mutase/prephenate dehydratase